MPRIAPLDPERASGETADIFREIKAAFGMVPNLFRASAHHPPLPRENWNKVKAVMAEGGLRRKGKETIALLVSKDNGCEYCVASHSAAWLKERHGIRGKDDAIAALDKALDAMTGKALE